MIEKSEKLKFRLYEYAPMFICTLFYIIGTIIAVNTFMFPSYSENAGPLIPTLIILVVMILVFIFAFFMYGNGKSIAIIICLFMTLAGLCYTQIKLQNNYPEDKFIDHDTISGKITALDRKGNKSITLILDDVILYQDDISQVVKGKLSFVIYGQSGSYLESEYYIKDSIIKAEAILEYPSINQDYGFYNERLHFLSSGIAYKASSHYAAISIAGKNKASLINTILNYRYKLFKRIDRFISGDEGDLVKALLTGEKDNLSYAVKSNFADLGISHLLATSGLHIGVILLAFLYVSKKIRLAVIPRTILSFFILFIFMLIAGFRISMVRAALMWTVLMGAHLTGRKVNIFNSLGGAMFVMMIINPLCIYDISFILSCISILSIAILYEPISSKFGRIKKNKSISIMFVTMAVIIFMWPILAYYFNSISILSPLFNIIFIPIISVLLILSLFFSVFSGISFIAAGFGIVVKALAFVVIYLAQFLEQFSVPIKVVSPPFIAIIFWILAIALFSKKIIYIKSKAKTFICVLLLAASVIIVIITQINTQKQEQMKVYSDSSVSIIYLQNSKSRALIMNEDCYISKTVLEKSATIKLDMLIYSGNNENDLTKILEDLSSFKINKIYAHESIVKKIDNDNVTSLDNIIFDCFEISLLPFKAKSKDAKIHYAAKIIHQEETSIYLDALSLRKGAFEDKKIDNIILSRWSKSRAQNIQEFEFERLYIYDGSHTYDNVIYSLEEKGSKIYNINTTKTLNFLKRVIR